MMTKEDACEFQVFNNRDLLIWRIYANAGDQTAAFVARPHSAFHDGKPMDFLLEAETLQEIRALLPPGLRYIPRSPEDAPVIVETWI
jgi:hypothetical protein